MSNELTVIEQPQRQLSFQETAQIADVFFKSGLFKDVADQAQAIVRIMAGREMGIGPFASMTGIHIIQGKATPSANVMASIVKGHPYYDYRVTQHTAEVCTIVFYEKGKPLGESTFTIEDAKAAGALSGKNAHTWKKYSRNMLFARAMSNGVKWFVPDVFGGAPTYTPEEFNIEVDENGDIANVQVSAPPRRQSQPEPEAPADPVAEVMEQARLSIKNLIPGIQQLVPERYGVKTAATGAAAKVAGHLFPGINGFPGKADVDSQNQRQAILVGTVAYGEARNNGSDENAALLLAYNAVVAKLGYNVLPGPETVDDMDNITDSEAPEYQG